MKNSTHNKKLKFFPIKSKAENLTFKITNAADLLQNISTWMTKDSFVEDSFVVVYMDFQVLMGRYRGNKFLFYNNENPDKETPEPRFVQRLRVFNPEEELLLWRSDDGFKGRIRWDNRGKDKEVDVVDAEQVLFGTRRGARKGTRKESLPEGFSEITEARGTRIILPFDKIYVDTKEAPKKRVFIKTRNYIEYNDIGQASYCDCRLLCFSDGTECLV